MYFVDFFFLVGPLYVDQTVPKEKDLEREMSSEFDGWVNKGGCWRPTECQARVKVGLLATFKFSISKHFIVLPFQIELAGALFWNVWEFAFPLSPNIHIQILLTDIHTFPRDTVSWEILIKGQSIFSLVIIWLILITISLDSIWILLGENSCWSLLGLKGLKICCHSDFMIYFVFWSFLFFLWGLSEKCGVSKLPPLPALAITIFKMRVIFCCWQELSKRIFYLCLKETWICFNHNIVWQLLYRRPVLCLNILTPITFCAFWNLPLLENCTPPPRTW